MAHTHTSVNECEHDQHDPNHGRLQRTAASCDQVVDHSIRHQQESRYPERAGQIRYLNQPGMLCLRDRQIPRKEQRHEPLECHKDHRRKECHRQIRVTAKAIGHDAEQQAGYALIEAEQQQASQGHNSGQSGKALEQKGHPGKSTETGDGSGDPGYKRGLPPVPSSVQPDEHGNHGKPGQPEEVARRSCHEPHAPGDCAERGQDRQVRDFLLVADDRSLTPSWCCRDVEGHGAVRTAARAPFSLYLTGTIPLQKGLSETIICEREQ